MNMTSGCRRGGVHTSVVVLPELMNGCHGSINLVSAQVTHALFSHNYVVDTENNALVVGTQTRPGFGSPQFPCCVGAGTPDGSYIYMQ